MLSLYIDEPYIQVLSLWLIIVSHIRLLVTILLLSFRQYSFTPFFPLTLDLAISITISTAETLLITCYGPQPTFVVR